MTNNLDVKDLPLGLAKNAYFGLLLDHAIIFLPDPDAGSNGGDRILHALDGVIAGDDGSWTVQLEAQPFEETGHDEDECIPIVSRDGVWDIGFKGDGRLYCRQTESTGIFECVSLDPVPMGEWLDINVSYRPSAGLLALDPSWKIYLESTEVPTKIVPVFPTPSIVSNSRCLQIGSANFYGRIKQVAVSRVYKEVAEQQDGTLKDDFKRTELTSLDSLPTDVAVMIVLMTPITNPPSPNGLARLCAIVRTSSGQDKFHVPIPDNTDTSFCEVHALCPGRSFSRDSWIECGYLPGMNGTFTVELWFMLGLPYPKGLPNVDRVYTIWALGADGVANRGARGWMAEIVARQDQTATQPIISLVVRTADVQDPSANSATMTIPLDNAIIGRWTLITLSVASYKFKLIAVNAVSQSVPSENEANIFSDAYKVGIRSWPLMLGAQTVDLTPQMYGEIAKSRVKSYNYRTKNNWYGYMKDYRIWVKNMNITDVKALYDSPVDEYASSDDLYFYIDLDVENPAEIPSNAGQRIDARVIRYSPQSSFDESIPVVVPEEHLSHPRLFTMIMDHYSRLGSSNMTMTIMSLSDTSSTPLIALVFGIVTTIVEIFIGGGMFDKKKLLNVLQILFGKSGGLNISSAIQAIVHAVTTPAATAVATAKAIGGAVIKFLYQLYESGVLRRIIGCVRISIFGVLRFLANFAPYIGFVGLLAKVVYHTAQLVLLVRVYIRDSQAAPDPLSLVLDDAYLSNIVRLVMGRSLAVKLGLNRPPQGDEKLNVTLTSDPVSALQIIPAQFEFDQYRSDAQITILGVDSQAPGIVKMRYSKGELLTVETVPEETFEISAPVELDVLGLADDKADIDVEWQTTWEGDADPPSVQEYYLIKDNGEVVLELKQYKVISQSTNKTQTAASAGSSTTNVVTRARSRQNAIPVATLRQATALLAKTPKSSARSKVEKKKRQTRKEITVYMANAAQGDLFWIHLKLTIPPADPNSKDDDEIYQATILVDGGPSKSRAADFWQTVAAEHLPPKSSSSGERSIDLIVSTHQDQDHNGGLKYMFTQMSSNALFAASAPNDPIKPGHTWINEPYGRKKRNADGIEVDDNDGAAPADDNDRKRSARGAGEIIKLLKDNQWDYTSAPITAASLLQGPAPAIAKTGTVIACNGPSQALVDAATKKPESISFNRSSIIFELNDVLGGDGATGFTSLWTGDAHDHFNQLDSTSATVHDIREAIGVSPGESKHYTMLKVGHHGSSHSNGKGFFYDVTADHYLISCNGGSHNPRVEVIQWICDGHAAMRAASTKSGKLVPPAPYIWLANPLHYSTIQTINRQSAKIMQRKPTDTTNGPLAAKNQGGYLMFVYDQGKLSSPAESDDLTAAVVRVHNQVVQYIPDEALTKRLSPNDPESLPSDDLMYPISARISMEEPEFEELFRYPGAADLNLVASALWGAYRGSPMNRDSKIEYVSDWPQLARGYNDQGIPNEIHFYYHENSRYLERKPAPDPWKFDFDPEGFVWLTQIMLSRRDTPSTNPGVINGIHGRQYMELAPDEYMVGLILKGNSITKLITGLILVTNTTERELLASKDPVVADYQPPSKSYAIVGFRRSVVDAPNTLHVGRPGGIGRSSDKLIRRLGIIWKKMPST